MSRAPRPTLYIHAGSHKTGTTAIQQAMHTGARELRAQGICWPLLGPVRGHSRLVRAVYDDGARSRVKARWLAARIRWQSRGLPATVLSSERIYRAGYEFFDDARQDTLENKARRIAFLGRLRALFEDDFDVRVLLYLRRADEFAESMYKELLFRKPYSGRFRFDAFLAEQTALFDYEGQVRELQDHLGPVTAQSYDQARRQGLVAHFCSQVGARPPASGELDQRVRRSASNTAALFLAQLAARRDLSHADRLQLLEFAMDGGLPDAPGRVRSLWPSSDALRSFMRRHATPSLDHLFAEVDWDRLQFGSMDEQEFAAGLATYDAWLRTRAAPAQIRGATA